MEGGGTEMEKRNGASRGKRIRTVKKEEERENLCVKKAGGFKAWASERKGMGPTRWPGTQASLHCQMGLGIFKRTMTKYNYSPFEVCTKKQVI